MGRKRWSCSALHAQQDLNCLARVGSLQPRSSMSVACPVSAPPDEGVVPQRFVQLLRL